MNLLLVLMCIFGLSQAKTFNKGTTCLCGWRNSGRIVGGKEARKNEYPWMVSIRLGDEHGCGGSIITRWHILTAAHCTNTLKPSQLTVSVGRHRTNVAKDTNSREYGVERIIQHEGYELMTTIHDIAIIVTSSQMSFDRNIGPVCLPNRRVDLVGQYVKVMGWGLTKGTGDRTALREVDVKVTPWEACRKDWPNLHPERTQLCAFENSKDSCSQDSGGPLVYLDSDTNRYTQAGIVSFGDLDCGNTTRPSVNADVSAYLDWINNAISSSHPSVRACIKV